MVRGKVKRVTRLRLDLVAIACACLLGQVSSLAHRVLVRHVICAEHGESVHVRSQGARAADSEAGGLAQRPTVVNGPSVRPDGHDHCSLAGTRSSNPQPPPDSVPGPEPLLACAGEVSDAAPGRVVPHYLVAPKTSPPVSTS